MRRDAALAAFSRRVLMTGVFALGVAAPAYSGAAGRTSHIVQVRDLPWRGGGNFLKRTLSVDASSREETALIKLGAQGKWRPRRTSEIFVLRGNISVGDQVLRRSTYAVSNHEIASRDGAVILVLEGAADRVARIIDSADIPWSYKEWIGAQSLPANGSPQFFMKPLSGFTQLLAVLPSGSEQPPRFAVGVDAECLCLQGHGLFGGIHELAAGSYGIIKAGEPFGPWSTEVGVVALVRFSGTPSVIASAAGALAPDTPTVRRVWDIERDSMP